MKPAPKVDVITMSPFLSLPSSWATASDDTGLELELDAPLTPADVVRGLVQAGCEVDEIRPERKGLEEVFLELVAKEPAP